MNDRELESLLRMVCEIDEIERTAGVSAPPAEQRQPALHRGAPPVHGEKRRPLAALRFARRPWRGALALGALAAAACLMLVFRAPTQPRRYYQAAAIPLDVAYCPGVADAHGQRVDRFEPTTPEYCVVLAIFHKWQNGCRCLTWQLHTWEDGRTVAEVRPGEAPEIALDVTDAPPVEQLLLVAISSRASDLPSDEAELDGLLDCLNDITPPTDGCENAEVCARAAQSCLPAGVTVVPRSFFVE